MAKAKYIKSVSVLPSSEDIRQKDIPIYQIPQLGTLVKEGRARHHLTQLELADKTKLTPAEISRIESGTILKPKKNVLKVLSPYIGISYSTLLFYVGYSDNVDVPEYYNSHGMLIPYEDIIEDIYFADPDLLDLLTDMDSFTSFQDKTLLKMLLTLMKKTGKTSDDNKSSERIKKIFAATKDFLHMQFAELLNNSSIA